MEQDVRGGRLMSPVCLAVACAAALALAALAPQASAAPSWLSETAGMWSDGAISDAEFLAAVSFLEEEGLVEMPQEGEAPWGLSADDAGRLAGLLGKGSGGLTGHPAVPFTDLNYSTDDWREHKGSMVHHRGEASRVIQPYGQDETFLLILPLNDGQGAQAAGGTAPHPDAQSRRVVADVSWLGEDLWATEPVEVRGRLDRPYKMPDGGAGYGVHPRIIADAITLPNDSVAWRPGHDVEPAPEPRQMTMQEALAAGTAEARERPQGLQGPRGGFVSEHVVWKEYTRAQRALNSYVAEQAEFLDSRVGMPRDIALAARDCGPGDRPEGAVPGLFASEWFDPAKGEVVLCYSLLGELEDALGPRAGGVRAVMTSVDFAAYRSVGYALILEHNLSVGQPADAAGQFAAAAVLGGSYGGAGHVLAALGAPSLAGGKPGAAEAALVAGEPEPRDGAYERLKAAADLACRTIGRSPAGEDLQAYGILIGYSSLLGALHEHRVYSGSAQESSPQEEGLSERDCRAEYAAGAWNRDLGRLADLSGRPVGVYTIAAYGGGPSSSLDGEDLEKWREEARERRDERRAAQDQASDEAGQLRPPAPQPPVVEPDWLHAIERGGGR